MYKKTREREREREREIPNENKTRQEIDFLNTLFLPESP